jgi:predicted nucleic acid-binding protein
VIVVDTSVLSLAYRRRSGSPGRHAEKLRALLQADEPIAIPGIVMQEVLSGVRNDADAQSLEDALAGFGLLLATRAIHVAAARLHTRCRARGIGAAMVDCLIAAHAVELGAPLFTADADFTHLATVVDLELLAV